MPKIISFLSEKGGSGKTTLATNIAYAIQRYQNIGPEQECETLLIDADPQGSSRDWNEANQGSLVPVIGLDRDTLAVDLRAISHGYQFIVIDGAPRIAKTTAAAIRCSQMVIIPVQPSPYDIWACADLVDLIKARQEVAEDKPNACFLISRAIKGTKLSREVHDALNEYGFPVMNSFTTQRIAYPTTATKGLSVYQSSDKEAIKEIDSIYYEILERLNYYGEL